MSQILNLWEEEAILKLPAPLLSNGSPPNPQGGLKHILELNTKKLMPMEEDFSSLEITGRFLEKIDVISNEAKRSEKSPRIVTNAGIRGFFICDRESGTK
jgi:hypothetical protein